MSGGYAYVLDETGEFASTLCNRAGVDLDPLESKDMEAVRNLVERHVEYTGSPRAQWILENWPEMLPKFIKVFPHEYKRVTGVARTEEAVKSMAVKGSETTQEARA
jgi:glutamate synthase domain-containing protein 3